MRNLLLVEENYIGLPDFVWGKAKDADASIVGLIPLQLIVLPHLERLKFEYKRHKFG